MDREKVRFELDGEVAVVRLDDGKVNALSPDVIEALRGALDRAEKEASSVLVIGREGCLSAGFDLKVMRSGSEPMRQLVTAGAELFMRIYGCPLPVVVACTGHALAAGAILLLSADLRLAARGDYQIGLNEVAIGIRLPIFAYELARERLSKRHFTRATSQAQLYAPDDAVDAGYLDRICDAGAVIPEALAEARRLAALPQPAFRNTKACIHEPALARIRDTLEADMRALAGGVQG